MSKDGISVVGGEEEETVVADGIIIGDEEKREEEVEKEKVIPEVTKTYQFSISSDLLRDYLGGRCSCAKLLGIDEDGLEELEVEEIINRIAQGQRVLENVSRSLTDTVKASFASDVLKDKTWIEITRMAREKGGEELREKLKKDIFEKRCNILRKRVEEDCIDRVLDEIEYNMCIKFAIDRGIPRKKAEEIILEVTNRLGAKILRKEEGDFAGGGLKILRDCPKNIRELPKAFFNDWTKVRQLFAKGIFSDFLRQVEAPREAVEYAEMSQEEYARVSDELKDAVIWGFLWRIGHKGIEIGMEGEKGDVAYDLGDILRICEGDSRRLIKALMSGRLEAWLRASLGENSLGKKAQEHRKKATASQDIEGEAQRFLWKIGEKRITILGKVYGAIEDVINEEITEEFLNEIYILYERGLLEAWVKQHNMEVAKRLKIAETWKTNKTRALALLYVLGLPYFRVADQKIDHPEKLLKLPRRKWDEIAKAIEDGSLFVFLAIRFGYSSKELNCIEEWMAKSKMGAVQVLFWVIGDKGLRLMDKVNRDIIVKNGVELVSIYMNGMNQEVLEAYMDGILTTWIRIFSILDEKIFEIEEIKTLDRKGLYVILWCCGWKTLPLKGEDGPDNIDEFIRWIDNLGSENAINFIDTGMLNLWLRYAQGRDDLAEKMPENLTDRFDLEKLLLMLGAERLEVFATPAEVDLKRVEEGNATDFIIKIFTRGKRGIAWGRISNLPINIRVEGNDKICLGPNQSKEIRFLLQTVKGIHLSNHIENIKVDLYDGQAEIVIPVRVSTIFPWSSLVMGALVGMVFGFLLMVFLKLWCDLSNKLVFPLDAVVAGILPALPIAYGLYRFSQKKEKETTDQQWYNFEICNQTISIQPKYYLYYNFQTLANMKSILVVGSFCASGGLGDDVIVRIIAKKDLKKYGSKGDIECYYDSGKVTKGEINVRLPQANMEYVLVFDNTFSIFSSKDVSAKVNLFYQLDSSKAGEG